MRPLPVDGGEPVLVACSHGTRLPAGRAQMTRFSLCLQALRPGLVVRQAFVDVQRPTAAEVVTRLAAAGRRSVVVPLLLSTGVHVGVDIAAAVAAGHGRSVAAEHLGVDGVLAPALADRLGAAGVADSDPVVVAAAGSRDPAARADVEAAAGSLRATRSGPVGVGYLTPAEGLPTVVEAVQALRASQGGRVAVATYLLSPGLFANRLTQVGADLLSAPLGLHRDVVARALACYDTALLT